MRDGRQRLLPEGRARGGGGRRRRRGGRGGGRQELARGGGRLQPGLVAGLVGDGRGGERERAAAAGGGGVVKGERLVERHDVAREGRVPGVAPRPVGGPRRRHEVAGRHGRIAAEERRV